MCCWCCKWKIASERRTCTFPAGVQGRFSHVSLRLFLVLPSLILVCWGTYAWVLTALYNLQNSDVFKCLSYFPVDKRLSRTPRRTQQPKTLNTPEDSTYYTLIHVSHSKDGDWFQILSTFPAICFYNALLIGIFFFCACTLTHICCQGDK